MCFLDVVGAEGCNLTLGFLPCFDGTCFLKEQACDGVKQCQDGADEMGCAYQQLHISQCDPHLCRPSRILTDKYIVYQNSHSVLNHLCQNPHPRDIFLLFKAQNHVCVCVGIY